MSGSGANCFVRLFLPGLKRSDYRANSRHEIIYESNDSGRRGASLKIEVGGRLERV